MAPISAVFTVLRDVLSIHPSLGAALSRLAAMMLALTYDGRSAVTSRISAGHFAKLGAQQLAGFGQVLFRPSRQLRARLERSAALVLVADGPGHPADVPLFRPVRFLRSPAARLPSPQPSRTR